MDFAAIDIGNSAVKACVWDGMKRSFEAFPSLHEAIDRLAGRCTIVYCTTRSFTPEEKEKLASTPDCIEFGPTWKTPLKVEYCSPETLGPDRLAAAIGARGLFPGKSLLVADVGTALTLDVVTSDGGYKGGNISVGLEMRLEALHRFTSKLPRVDLEGSERQVFGHDTRSALQSGARRGVAAEIAGAYLLARRIYGCEMVVLTGGGAQVITNDLMEVLEDGTPVAFESALVEEGLKTAFEYNRYEQT